MRDRFLLMYTTEGTAHATRHSLHEDRLALLSTNAHRTHAGQHHCSAMKAMRSRMKALELSTPVPPSRMRMPALHPSPFSPCAHHTAASATRSLLHRTIPWLRNRSMHARALACTGGAVKVQ